MTEKELMDMALLIKQLGGSFGLAFWFAYLLKRYVINGTAKKVGDYMESQSRYHGEISRMLKAVIRHEGIELPDSEGKDGDGK